MAQRVSAEDFNAKVLESDLPVIVDFYSDSCVACKKLAPALGDFEDDFEDKVSVVKVNTNFDADLAADYGIMSNPTLVIFYKGDVVAKRVGAATKKELEDWFIEKYNSLES